MSFKKHLIPLMALGLILISCKKVNTNITFHDDVKLKKFSIFSGKKRIDAGSYFGKITFTPKNAYLKLDGVSGKFRFKSNKPFKKILNYDSYTMRSSKNGQPVDLIIENIERVRDHKKTTYNNGSCIDNEREVEIIEVYETTHQIDYSLEKDGYQVAQGKTSVEGKDFRDVVETHTEDCMSGGEVALNVLETAAHVAHHSNDRRNRRCPHHNNWGLGARGRDNRNSSGIGRRDRDNRNSSIAEERVLSRAIDRAIEEIGDNY